MGKRRLRKNLVKPLIITGIVAALGIIILILYLFVFNNIHFLGIKSVNAEAKTYKTKTCLAFHPDTKDGKKVVKDLCDKQGDMETIFDYALIPYGDYYLVEYGNDVHYYIDHENKPLKIETISEEGKNILSEYLRYDMKKDEIDKAYTFDFIKETSVENLDISECIFEIDGKDLAVYYPKYDYTSYIPLIYMQKPANINLGYENAKYVKPTYISKNRKIVAFTFDDGPNMKTTPQIIDTLYEADAVATFFVVGYNLEPNTIDLIANSIAKGNEYGSHTQSHPYLRLLSPQEEYEEIVGPAKDLKDGYHDGGEYDFDGLGYEMKLYRAPYGEHKSSAETMSPYMSIEWDCDSKDWDYRDVNIIKEKIYDFESKNKDGLDGCIVLFHDLYQETADAISELVPELTNKGYQFVTVSDLLDILKVDKTKTYYPW